MKPKPKKSRPLKLTRRSFLENLAPVGPLQRQAQPESKAIMLMVSAKDQTPFSAGNGVIPILVSQEHVQACVCALGERTLGDGPIRQLLTAIVRAWLQIPR